MWFQQSPAHANKAHNAPWTKPLSSIGFFFRNDGGSFTLQTAAIILPMLVAIGFAVDYSRADNARTKLQATADSVFMALSSSDELSESQFPELAEKWILSNAQTLDSGKISASLKRTPGTKYDDYFVDLTYPLDTAFMGIVGLDTVTVSVAASARVAKTDAAGACVIALDPLSKESFYISGNGTVSVPNCGIYVNSSSTSAMKQSGRGKITAKNIWIVGRPANSGEYSPTPIDNQPPIADPLASVPEPAVPSACDYSNTHFTTPMAFPGGTTYCGDIVFSADTVFGPGIHYFKDAVASVSSNMNISGSDVMLFFDKNSLFSRSSGGAVTLSAMESGPYKGIAMFSSRLRATLATFTFAGNKGYFVNGSIYLPKGILHMLGTGDLNVTSKSGWVIAWRFHYQGDSSFVMDSFGSSVPDTFGDKPATVALTK